MLVIPNIPAPVERNEFARDPVTVNGVRPNGPSITDLLGVPEMIVPAGYNEVVYESQYELSADKKSYVVGAGHRAVAHAAQPMPTSMMFWAGPGDEPRVLQRGIGVRGGDAPPRPTAGLRAAPRRAVDDPAQMASTNIQRTLHAHSTARASAHD